jgi:hypothetical protein
MALILYRYNTHVWSVSLVDFLPLSINHLIDPPPLKSGTFPTCGFRSGRNERQLLKTLPFPSSRNNWWSLRLFPPQRPKTSRIHLLKSSNPLSRVNQSINQARTSGSQPYPPKAKIPQTCSTITTTSLNARHTHTTRSACLNNPIASPRQLQRTAVTIVIADLDLDVAGA